MFNRKSKIGQNIAEYSILIALIIAAAIAMQTYVKRGLQGKIKDAVSAPATVDAGQAGQSYTITFTGNQFEPDYLTSKSDVASKRVAENVTYSARGGINKTGVEESTFRKAGGFENITWNGTQPSMP
jgi:hypothetical protein